MVTLLAKFFIKDSYTDEQKRTAYGTLCGAAGIILNMLMFAGKFIAGTIAKSVSITADAFNNLSDAGSSLVTIVGFKLASQKPDKDHPYGHGRIEYLTGLVVAAIIFIMGFELLKESINKIIHPETTEFSLLSLSVLAAAILVKFYMAFYNTSIGKKINSAALAATAKDSLSDCIATSVVLITSIISHFFKINLDGYAGVVVSVFIFIAGFSAAKESVDPLLGNPPTQDFIDKIEDIVLNFDKNTIIGIHDLMVHDYGPGRLIISLHAEVPADGNILDIHDVVDNLERKLSTELGCSATIHMDPVDNKTPEVLMLKEKTKQLVSEVYREINIHDFRVVFGDTHTNIIFDMDVPFSCKISDDDLKHQVQQKIKEQIGQHHFAVITIDRDNYIHK